MKHIVGIGCMALLLGGLVFLMQENSNVAYLSRERCLVQVRGNKTLVGNDDVVVGSGLMGVATIDMRSGLAVSAAHVLRDCVPPTVTSSGSCWYGLGEEHHDVGIVEIVGSRDLARFRLTRRSCLGLHIESDSNFYISGSGVSGEINHRLITFDIQGSGISRDILYRENEDRINYDPEYGQSGSPVFSGDVLWGIVSRKRKGGAIIQKLR